MFGALKLPMYLSNIHDIGSAGTLGKPQKKIRYFTLQKTKGFQERQQNISPFYPLPAFIRKKPRTHLQTKKKRKTDEMQNKGRNDVSTLPFFLATEKGNGKYVIGIGRSLWEVGGR